MGTEIIKTNNRIKIVAVGGFVIPKLTTIERDAIASPENGMFIFNTTAGEYQVYDGSWGAIGGGSTSRSVVSKAIGDSPYTATIGEDVLVDASGGNVTVNLPAASGLSGQSIWVSKRDSSVNTVTIDGNGSETINGNLTLVISSQYDAFELMSDGTNWYIR